MDNKIADSFEGAERKKQILFIINPISGGRSSKGIPDRIKAGIDSGKYEYKFKFTESAGHAITLANEAIADKTDIIVAVGGDGTMNEVASCLIKSNSILGIIPVGSGNGLARHLGIPLNINKAIQLIDQGHYQLIDTVSINKRPFISIAGVGFDALIAKKFASSKKRGIINYLRLIASLYIPYKPKKHKLKINGTTIISRVLFISFANSNQFGYNTQIAPKAKLTDGLLDICIVKKPKLFELPLIANLLLLKMIDKSPHVNIIQSNKVTVKRKRGKYVNIDGEAIKMSKKLEVKIVPLSLNVIIPEHVKEEK